MWVNNKLGVVPRLCRPLSRATFCLIIENMEGINMKKLLKASLTVMMALTLSACGGSKDVNIGIVQYA